MTTPINTITPREQRMVAALTKIMLETIPHDGKKFSGDSYLPDDFLDEGMLALEAYGVRFDQDGTTHFERVAA